MERTTMAYAFVQDVPIDEQVYRQIIDRLGPDTLEGLIAHLALRNDDNTLRYVDVWESEEACERAFDERIHPAVGAVFREIGFKPAGEPERKIMDLIDIQTPASTSVR
jgi:hypothetical protein